LALRIDRQPDLTVCGEAEDLAEALKLVERERPDVVVIDVGLKTGSGIDLVQRIQARDASIRLLVWSMHPDALYAERALRAGALGYVNKAQATTRIVEAIRCILEGRIFLSEETAERLLHVAVGGRRAFDESPVAALSNRELEVFELIGTGMKTSEIAARLRLSPHTIETHQQRIKEKLQQRNAAELRRAAVQWVLERG
jgi:DNA-binding NarL/FixJ family response regulator